MQADPGRADSSEENRMEHGQAAGRFDGRTTRAAVFRAPNRPLEVETVEIAEPGPGEVLVKLAASGVCHSDHSFYVGKWATTTPLILGHEGAGTVAAVGPGVEHPSVGDAVILQWAANCRRCESCVAGLPQLCTVGATTINRNVMWDGTTRLRQHGQPVYSLTCVGTFAEYAVVPESAVVTISPDVAMDRAALVGCAVTTGFGAVVNTAKVPVGATVAVIGCGGVGLSAMLGALTSGASQVIMLDLNDEKLSAATKLGATDVVNPARTDPVSAIRDRTNGHGVDFVFEAVGSGRTIEQGAEMIRAGGTLVMVGMAPDGVRVSFDALKITDRELKIIGSNYGSCRPTIDFRRILDLYTRGTLPLDALISNRIGLDDVNEAFAKLDSGHGLRDVIVF
jgi:S-(hydroxymethyl)glutathione dehydrogenase / alcohol dehydrogenase